MMEKHNRPDLDNEMDELQRVVQDLSRDEDITVSVDDLVKVFKNAKEVTLSDEIWGNLENTESKKICHKLGFQVYAQEHHAFMKEGRWHDLIWYELLKNKKNETE